MEVRGERNKDSVFTIYEYEMKDFKDDIDAFKQLLNKYLRSLVVDSLKYGISEEEYMKAVVVYIGFNQKNSPDEAYISDIKRAVMEVVRKFSTDLDERMLRIEYSYIV